MGPSAPSSSTHPLLGHMGQTHTTRLQTGWGVTGRDCRLGQENSSFCVKGWESRLGWKCATNPKELRSRKHEEKRRNRFHARKRDLAGEDFTSAYSADGAVEGLVDDDIVAGGDLVGNEIAWGSPCASGRSPERERAKLVSVVKTEEDSVRFLEGNG
uniref:Uncharacterized protein n=1 Tax=Oryza glaberrima TaxID=4538 RepID=I1QXH9_ORYGL